METCDIVIVRVPWKRPPDAELPPSTFSFVDEEGNKIERKLDLYELYKTVFECNFQWSLIGRKTKISPHEARIIFSSHFGDRRLSAKSLSCSSFDELESPPLSSSEPSPFLTPSSTPPSTSSRSPSSSTPPSSSSPSPSNSSTKKGDEVHSSSVMLSALMDHFEE